MLPAKLKSNSLNQIDQSLENIRAANRISLSAHNLVIDGHIATAVLISLINEFRAVRCEVSPAEVAMAQQKSSAAMTCGIVALSDEGDSFLVSAEEEGPVTLRSYLHIDEVVDEFSGTWSELKKPLGLCAEVLVIRYADPATSGAPRPYSHNTGDSPNNSSSFVTDQFLNHKRYAWGIIGISVVLALLGVATPLGFQTFADKILPYSAMNSLIVAVVLLLLAAVVAVISLLVVLPILFVYSVQLSLVVLAIGFDMAFTVGVALRPLRNRVQQAYGYDASFQSVLFDTLEPPISSRFWN